MTVVQDVSVYTYTSIERRAEEPSDARAAVARAKSELFDKPREISVRTRLRGGVGLINRIFSTTDLRRECMGHVLRPVI